MKTNKALITVLGLIILAGTPALALAMEGEYYVYNGFEPITNAFRKMALITSDNAYKSLFGIAIALSVFLGGTLNFFKTLTSGKGSLIAWFFPFLAGAAVYAGFFAKSGTIHIYDEVQNRYEAVSGIPDGVILLATSLNSIERGVVEIIYTSGTVGDYQRQAGGISFDLFSKMAQVPVASTEANMSLQKYITDCVIFETQRPGTSLSMSDILTPPTGSDIFTELKLAENPSIFTVTYLTGTGAASTVPAGTTTSCTDAYANLVAAYKTNAATTMKQVMTGVCTKAGYSSAGTSATTGTTSIESCRTNTANMIQTLIGSAVTIEDHLAQSEVAKTYYNSVAVADPITATMLQANKSMTTGVTSGFAMASQIPIMKAVFTGLILTLIPILMIFIPTSACGRALSLIVGFFILLTSWSICDAVIHSALMDYAVKYFADIKASPNGLIYYLTFPDTATATMAVFGSMRGLGLGLASTITYQLVKFGGTQLGGLITGIQTNAQQQSNKAGDAMTSIDTKGQELSRMLSGAATMSNQSRFGTEQMTDAANWGAGAQIANTLGGKAGAGGNLDTMFEKAKYDMQSQLATMRGEVAAMGGAGQAVDAKEKVAGMQLLKSSAGVDATEKLFAAAQKSGFIDKDASFGQFLEKMQSKGEVIGNNGESYTMQVGKDGQMMGVVKFGNSNGATTSRDVVNGENIRSEIKAGGGSFVVGKDGKLMNAQVAGVGAAISSSLDTKATQEVADTWAQKIAYDEKGSVDWAKTEKAGVSKEHVHAVAKDVSTSIAKSVAKARGLSETQETAFQKSLEANLQADPVKLMGLLTGGIKGAAAAGIITQAASVLAGVKLSTAAGASLSSGHRGANQTSVTVGDDKTVQDAIKNGVSDATKTSHAIERMKKQAYQMSSSDSSGHDKSYKNASSYVEGKGVQLQDNVETQFIESVANSKFKDIGAGGGNTAFENRMIAAVNFLGQSDNKEETMKLFDAYLQERATADPKLNGAKADVEGRGNEIHEAHHGKIDNVGGAVDPQTQNMPTAVEANLKKAEKAIPGAAGSPIAGEHNKRVKSVTKEQKQTDTNIQGKEDNYGLLDKIPDPDKVNQPPTAADGVLGDGLLNKAVGALGKAVGEVGETVKQGVEHVTSGEYGKEAARDASAGGKAWLERNKPAPNSVGIGDAVEGIRNVVENVTENVTSGEYGKVAARDASAGGGGWRERNEPAANSVGISDAVDGTGKVVGGVGKAVREGVNNVASGEYGKVAARDASAGGERWQERNKPATEK